MRRTAGVVNGASDRVAERNRRDLNWLELWSTRQRDSARAEPHVAGAGVLAACRFDREHVREGDAGSAHTCLLRGFVGIVLRREE